MPIELQDVIAELRFDRPFDLIDLHAEGRIGEGTDKHLALGPTEIAALGRGARILREFLRQLREILARLRTLQDALRLGLDRRVLFRIVHRQQNVAHAALFRPA